MLALWGILLLFAILSFSSALDLCGTNGPSPFDTVNLLPSTFLDRKSCNRACFKKCTNDNHCALALCTKITVPDWYLPPSPGKLPVVLYPHLGYNHSAVYVCWKRQCP
jgi:hypothetical protein